MKTLENRMFSLPCSAFYPEIALFFKQLIDVNGIITDLVKYETV